jgi:hypothetical protein
VTRGVTTGCNSKRPDSCFYLLLATFLCSLLFVPFDMGACTSHSAAAAEAPTYAPKPNPRVDEGGRAAQSASSAAPSVASPAGRLEEAALGDSAHDTTDASYGSAAPVAAPVAPPAPIELDPPCVPEGFNSRGQQTIEEDCSSVESARGHVGFCSSRPLCSAREALASVKLEALDGTQLGGRVADAVLKDELVEDDGTFRAPALALMQLFDEDRDGLLRGDEAYRMLRSFAEPLAAGRHEGDGGECSYEEIEEAVRELHALLLSTTRDPDGGIDLDDVECFLERMDEQPVPA